MPELFLKCHLNTRYEKTKHLTLQRIVLQKREAFYSQNNYSVYESRPSTVPWHFIKRYVIIVDANAVEVYPFGQFSRSHPELMQVAFQIHALFIYFVKWETLTQFSGYFIVLLLIYLEGSRLLYCIFFTFYETI